MPDNLVDVWIAEPPSITDKQLLAAYERLLSAAERERQRRLLLAEHRHEYLIAHALLRATLSKYDATPPADWRFATNAYGRPVIEPPSPLRFNLAHHPTLVVCAVTLEAEIGVDVEPLERAATILSVADDVFTPSERAELQALPPAASRERAVLLWTLKEAYVKARGLGLTLPLDGFGFSFDDGELGVRFGPAFDDRPERWAFRSREINGHLISLAVERGQAEPEIRFHFNVPLQGPSPGSASGC
jgi:4'-phosphopantetheinyl transferase